MTKEFIEKACIILDKLYFLKSLENIWKEFNPWKTLLNIEFIIRRKTNGLINLYFFGIKWMSKIKILKIKKRCYTATLFK